MASNSALHEQGPGGAGGRSTRALSIGKLLPLKGLRAIDLGSNQGYNSFDLADCGCREVLGVEIRERFLEEAHRLKREGGYDQVNFRDLDVRRIDELGLGRFDLCLCAGLLYHMQNPFNLLKRMRNLCRFLALETHIAPSFWRFFAASRKYREYLTFRTHSVSFDGVKFSGRLNIFPEQQDMLNTSGSVVSRSTFWLNQKSLERAISLAGFKMRAIYFAGPPVNQPEILVHYGPSRSKIFCLAEVVEPERTIPVCESRIEGADLLAASS